MPALKILINPTSGNSAGKKLFAIATKLTAVQAVAMTDPAQIMLQIKNFVQSGDTLIIAGGDGTVNLIMNALFHTGLYTKIKVALFPIGTGNDLAQAYNIKKTSLENFIKNIIHKETLSLPLWRFNNLVFTNYISWGIDAWALKLVASWRHKLPAKRWIMQSLYFCAGMLTLLQWRKIHLRSNALPLPQTQLAVILCNINSYAGGCPLATNLEAKPALHLIILKHHFDLINLMWRRFSKRPYPTTTISNPTVTITTTKVIAEIDGELIDTIAGTIHFCGYIDFLV